jgi:hypothetical protein
MNTELKRGQLVTAIEYGGKRLKRRVVIDHGRTVVVCTEEEFSRAARENRGPDGIGFPKKDVRQISS